MEREDSLKKQFVLYFLFAFCMIVINYLIQKLNQIILNPLICESFGSNEIIYALYCSMIPYNMSELIGSILAVGITYIIKFFLDKYVVFQKSGSKLKETSQEFLKYFLFAVLTTIENIGIQFLLSNFLKTPLEISFIIALTIGYLTKFYLDKKYVFTHNYVS